MSKIHIQYRILYIRFLNTKQPIPIIIRSIAHTFTYGKASRLLNYNTVEC